MSKDYIYTQKDLDNADKKRKLKILLDSNIPDDLLQYKWSDYKIDNNEQFDSDGKPIFLKKEIIESRRQALVQCSAYAKNLPLMQKGELPWSSILITGEKGTGKSVLGSLILRSAVESLMKEVFYISFPILISEIHGRPEIVDKKISQYSEYDFLMIDEIDFGYKMPQWKIDILNTILTKRALYNNPTIITSKVPYEFMANIVGVPIFRLLGREETYFRIAISNERYKNPEELLSPNTSYPRGKALAFLSLLKQIIEGNKGKTGTGFRGNQLGILLQSAMYGGHQTAQQRDMMMEYASDNISEVEVQQIEGVEATDIDRDRMNERAKEEIAVEEGKDILDEMGLDIDGGI